jgi:hypothetical protein
MRPTIDAQCVLVVVADAGGPTVAGTGATGRS